MSVVAIMFLLYEKKIICRKSPVAQPKKKSFFFCFWEKGRKWCLMSKSCSFQRGTSGEQECNFTFLLCWTGLEFIVMQKKNVIFFGNLYMTINSSPVQKKSKKKLLSCSSLVSLWNEQHFDIKHHLLLLGWASESMFVKTLTYQPGRFVWKQSVDTCQIISKIKAKLEINIITCVFYCSIFFCEERKKFIVARNGYTKIDFIQCYVFCLFHFCFLCDNFATD